MPDPSPGKFFVTTAIDYANSRPHLGTAYEKIGADVIARYRRLRGEDVFFLMGNDEHSLNVEKRARELGKDPQTYCDEMAEIFKDTWRRLEVSFDRFIRTTDPDHKAAVRRFLQVIHENGRNDIYKGHYEGWYCVSCEAFYQEKDLAGGNCPTHGTKPEWIREANWFFRLSAYQEKLRAYILEHPGFIQPEARRNEILNVIEGGLQDVSISRAGTKWGIPLAFDEGSVAYVWVDALINYVTGAGYEADEARFAERWPADLHVIGKDITRFHCVIWPALLWAAGLAPPRTVHAHGFVNLAGAKMSKTLGTVLDPIEVADRIGVDALRYFLMREIPFDRDGDFTWERVQDVCNADLANGIGNLLARTTAMVERYQEGRVVKREGPLAEGFRRDLELDGPEGHLGLYDHWMNRNMASAALRHAWTIVLGLNGFIADRKPFLIAKDPSRKSEVEEILYACADTLRILAILVQPVIPTASTRIWEQLGLPGQVTDQRILDLSTSSSNAAGDARAWGRFPDGTRVRKGESLFPRLELVPPSGANL
jgi:methionyl-tRNA synthetase